MSSTILYLGTSPSHFPRQEGLLHYPVIQLIPASLDEPKVRFCLDRLEKFTHCLLTSKNAVQVLLSLCEQASLDFTSCLQNKCISIGPSTTSALHDNGVFPLFEALDSTQEGMIALCKEQISSSCYVFYPRSSLARPFLGEYLSSAFIQHEILDLYKTVYQVPTPIPSLEKIEEIVFTSPSTVDGFFKIFQKIPEGKKITFQGPITKQRFYELGGPI